jgi:hypothetical protein
MERFMNHSLLPLGAALLALGLGALPAAQAQNVKPPKAQLWMDVSTGGMAGMPEMDASSGMGAMLGGSWAARVAAPAATPPTAWPAA